jgi:hypothetical protein
MARLYRNAAKTFGFQPRFFMRHSNARIRAKSRRCLSIFGGTP